MIVFNCQSIRYKYLEGEKKKAVLGYLLATSQLLLEEVREAKIVYFKLRDDKK